MTDDPWSDHDRDDLYPRRDRGGQRSPLTFDEAMREAGIDPRIADPDRRQSDAAARVRNGHPSANAELRDGSGVDSRTPDAPDAQDGPQAQLSPEDWR